jgi:hypothetical protein
MKNGIVGGGLQFFFYRVLRVSDTGSNTYDDAHDPSHYWWSPMMAKVGFYSSTWINTGVEIL